MLMRNVFEKSSKMHRGIWDKSAKGCREIRGKKLGIIGYGNIGSQLSVLAESMGMEVYFYDIQDKLPLGNAKKVDSIEELLKKVGEASHDHNIDSLGYAKGRERLASPIYVSVLKNQKDKYLPVASTLNTVFKSAGGTVDSKRQNEFKGVIL